MFKTDYIIILDVKKVQKSTRLKTVCRRENENPCANSAGPRAGCREISPNKTGILRNIAA